MEKTKKRLRKKLKNKFISPYKKEYHTKGAILEWFKQCGIKDKHLEKCYQYTGIIYPYNEKDRKRIIYAVSI